MRQLTPTVSASRQLAPGRRVSLGLDTGHMPMCLTAIITGRHIAIIDIRDTRAVSVADSRPIGYLVARQFER